VFFYLSKLLAVFLAPLTWACALFVAAAVIAARSAQRTRLVAGLIVGGLAILSVFSLEAVANGLERSLEDSRSTIRDDVTYDTVVLLGGIVQVFADQPEGRRSYNDNVERLLATYDLLRTGRAATAIISGGHVDASRPEAKEAPTLAAQLTDWGIDPSRLIIDATALNTRDNATHAKAIIEQHGWSNVLIVTSAFHMTRALECFHAAGLTPDTLVVDRRATAEARTSYLPRSDALERSTAALHEWFGRWMYRRMGYAR
jgi:uncharacterized SAM-binding protein YcdF (DUF218 family)